MITDKELDKELAMMEKAKEHYFDGINDGKYADKDSITAVFAAWDEPAIGAAKALQEAGRDEVIVTGVDGNEQAVEMIKDGTNLKATVKQNFEGMAGIVCEQMEKYFDGEEIEKGEMYAPAELITQENAQ